MAEVENPALAVENIVGEEDNAKRKRETESSAGLEAGGKSSSDPETVETVKKGKVDGEVQGVIEQKDTSKETGHEKEVAGQSETSKDESVGTRITLGPKKFGNAVELFTYFYKLLQLWPMNVDTNKYESMVLTDLLLKGHTNSLSKVGAGILAFQVQIHPTWKSRCYYVVRVDGSCDDFSYRKCCDHILPLPAEYISDGRVCTDMLNVGDIHKFKDLRGEEGHSEGSRGRGRGYRVGGGGRGGRGAGGGRGGGFRGGGGGGYRGGGNRGRGRGGRGRG